MAGSSSLFMVSASAFTGNSSYLVAVHGGKSPATAILAMLPPVAVVVFMQRLFVRGLVETEK